MPQKEILDAYDAQGNKLGFDLYRDNCLNRPEDVYIIVAEVYTVTKDREVLITQRHPDKGWPLKWEITGGCIQKGETPQEGALRELREETGIIAHSKDLHSVYSYIMDGTSTIFKCYMVTIEKEKTVVKLQDGETVAYRFVPYEEFKKLIQTDMFVNLHRNRFNTHVKLFDKIIELV